MNKIQNDERKDDQGQDQLRSQLEQKISQFKQKITNYEQLERQINQISIIVNQPKSSQNSNARQLKNSKISEAQPKQVHNQRRTTNKKIKIYDLRKKLDKMIGQQNEKKSMFYQSKEKHSKLQNMVENINQEIQQEKKKAKSLVELQQRILNDVAAQEQKVSEELYSLQQTVKKKEMFNFQKRKIRDQIRKVRFSINNLINQSNSKDLQLSLSLQRGDQNYSEIDKDIVSENSLGMNETAMWIGRQKQRIQDFQTKIQIIRQKNAQMMNFFFNLKKKIEDDQILAKHHKLTIKMQSNQLENYNSFIQQAKKNIKDNNYKCQQISTQLRKAEGERGYLRGKVGVVIQQQRLVKSINLLAESDFQNLRQRLTQLNNIKKMFNWQKIRSQNF